MELKKQIKTIQVLISDMKIAHSPDLIRTVVGSCMAIMIYDDKNKIGSISHIMLADAPPDAKNPNKYADTAVPYQIEKLLRKGANRQYLRAKIAGGANMFKQVNKSSLGLIGERNIERTGEMLKKHGIKLLAKHVGENYGRKVTLDPATGKVTIECFGKEISII